MALAHPAQLARPPRSGPRRRTKGAEVPRRLRGLGGWPWPGPLTLLGPLGPLGLGRRGLRALALAGPAQPSGLLSPPRPPRSGWRGLRGLRAGLGMDRSAPFGPRGPLRAPRSGPRELRGLTCWPWYGPLSHLGPDRWGREGQGAQGPLRPARTPRSEPRGRGTRGRRASGLALAQPAQPPFFLLIST